MTKQNYPAKNGKKNTPEETVDVFGKVPPQALEAEEAVLGAVILEQDCLLTVLGLIPDARCFYSNSHRRVYEAIMALEKEGSKVDLLTVMDMLKRQGSFDAIGGGYFVTKLTFNVVTSAHVETHAKYVMEAFLKREAISVASSLLKDAYDASIDAFELIDKTEREVSNIIGNNVSADAKNALQLVVEVQKELQLLVSKKGKMPGIPTGSTDLDNFTSGWKTGLIVIGARPAVGKSAFVVCSALHAAQNGYGVAIFSLEMKAHEIMKRIVSNMAGVEFDLIMSGNYGPEEQKRIDQQLSRFSKLNIHIDDAYTLNLPQLKSKARRMVRKQGVQMIVLDYLQLLSLGTDTKQIREQQIAAMTRELKKLSAELNVPVIVLSQLNRASEDKKENDKTKSPPLSALRESGAIEQDADMVLFLYGPDDGDPDGTGQNHDKDNIDRYIKIAKQRNGGNHVVKLKFHGNYQRFVDYDYNAHANPFAGINRNEPPKFNDYDSPF